MSKSRHFNNHAGFSVFFGGVLQRDKLCETVVIGFMRAIKYRIYQHSFFLPAYSQKPKTKAAEGYSSALSKAL